MTDSTIPDDPDALSQVNSQEKADSPPIDPIELEEGPFVLATKGDPKLNVPALARKVATSKGLAWCPISQQFHEYSPSAGIWIPTEVNTVRWVAGQVLKHLALERTMPALFFKRGPAVLKGLIETLKGCCTLGSAPSSEAQLLPLQNGVLDLSGDEPVLRAFKREDWFTRKAPVKWTPEATCEKWVNDLLLAGLKHQDDLSLLQRALGSMLIGGNPAQFILLMMGKGGSGKSTAVSVFEQLMGVENIAHLRTDRISGRFEAHFYQGKSILVAKDVPPNFLQKGGSNLKWLTGADLIQTEQKYGGKSHMQGTKNVIVTANAAPLLKIEGDAEAWERRILPIEFAKEPTSRLLSFDKLLVTEEGEGILAWLVKGYSAARAEFKELGFFKLTDDQKLRRRAFIDASQSELVFVRDQVVKGNGSLSVDECYKAYMRHCKERGWTPLPAQKFLTELPNLMITHHDVHRRHDIEREGKLVRGFKGVILGSKPQSGTDTRTE